VSERYLVETHLSV